MTIKEFRLSQKLSQAELATALGISVSSERQYEYGKREPSATVVARIKEIYGVDLSGAVAVEEAPTALAVEEKAAKPKRTRKKKDAAAEAAPAEPVPAVEEAPAKPAKRTRKKKEAAAEAATEPIPAVVEAAPAPVVEEAPAKPAKRTRKKKEAAPAPAIEEKAEKSPAKKPRTRKKKEEPATAPVDELLLQMQNNAEAAVNALFDTKGTVIIQSPMGGEITPEDVLAKVGPVDKVYVRVDLNTAFWVRGDESGAVNLW